LPRGSIKDAKLVSDDSCQVKDIHHCGPGGHSQQMECPRRVYQFPHSIAPTPSFGYAIVGGRVLETVSDQGMHVFNYLGRGHIVDSKAFRHQ